MDITDRVFMRMKELGITQVDLGNAAGITKSTINYIFTNHKHFDADNIVALADKLQVTVSWLLTGGEELNAKEIIREIPVDLGEDEQELVDVYRALDREGKVEVLHTAYVQRGRVSASKEKKVEIEQDQTA